MDKLVLKNMVFHAYHGHFKVEHEVGQKFEVDVEIYTDLAAAGKSDQLTDTIDINAVYRIVEKTVMNEERFNLIESIAERISEKLLSTFPAIAQTVIRVRKDKAPVKGILDYAEVEICRKQKPAPSL